MANIFTRKDRGQAVVLVAIIMVAMVAMAALMIDGGFMLLNRGQAQAAADAGALAGARSICDNNYVLNTTNVQDALTANKATGTITQSTKFISRDSVTVTASITNPTFFAKIFKKGSVVSKATAIGTCLIPGNLYQVLPLAFQCQNPTVAVNNLKGCGGLTIDPWHDGIYQGSGPLYIFVDGEDYTSSSCRHGNTTTPRPESCNRICSSGTGGNMVCSSLTVTTSHGNQPLIVFAGYNSSGYNRGFLPSACSSGHGSISSSCVSTPESSTSAFSEIDLNDSVTGDFQGGNSFYGAIKTSTSGNDNVYLMPFFSDQPTWTSGRYSSVSYHIIGEMGFIVSCVNTTTRGSSLRCPGTIALYNANRSLFGSNGSPLTIEGYFVNDLPFNLINPGYSQIYRVGVNYVSLTK